MNLRNNTFHSISSDIFFEEPKIRTLLFFSQWIRFAPVAFWTMFDIVPQSVLVERCCSDLNVPRWLEISKHFMQHISKNKWNDQTKLVLAKNKLVDWDVSFDLTVRAYSLIHVLVPIPISSLYSIHLELTIHLTILLNSPSMLAKKKPKNKVKIISQSDNLNNMQSRAKKPLEHKFQQCCQVLFRLHVQNDEHEFWWSTNGRHPENIYLKFGIWFF